MRQDWTHTKILSKQEHEDKYMRQDKAIYIHKTIETSKTRQPA